MNNSVKAHLYFHDSLIKQIVLSCFTRDIRLSTYGRQSALRAFDDGDMLSLQMVPIDVMVFTYTRRLSYDEVRYDFSYIEKASDPVLVDVTNEGFMEPNENLNLDKLAVKCKKNDKVKELLTKYYRRR